MQLPSPNRRDQIGQSRKRGHPAYDCSMQHEEPVTAAPDDIETKLSAVAHHEAGHMVIAAAVGLPLKPGGLSIDRVGEGLACYCFRPDETAVSQERVILATFAGWYAQKRFSDLRSISCADFAHPEST